MASTPTPEEELFNIRTRLNVIADRSMQGKGDSELRSSWALEAEALRARRTELNAQGYTLTEEEHTEHPRLPGRCAKCGGSFPCQYITGKFETHVSDLYGPRDD